MPPNASASRRRADHSTAEPEHSDNPIPLHDLHPEPEDMLGAVLEGLRAVPKTLPCKYFYDQIGSQLFDQICELPEYYPTRTEVGILERSAADIATALGEDALVIELGSGSSTKTHVLLRALDSPAGYVPVDISREHLQAAAARIRDAFPSLPVHPICADFTDRFSLPELDATPKRRYVFFPGSTLGNFDPTSRLVLLEQIVDLCGSEGGGLLIGLDLIKDRQRLESAYNDAAGVTADFNMNLLVRLNRELGAGFELEGFEHRAPYNPDAERVEMHLVATRDQTVAIGDEVISFSKDESICTEHSYKFALESFSQLAKVAGLKLRNVWTDDDEQFAVVLLETPQTG
jgi:dimethylhistidine N-methyltransferase